MIETMWIVISSFCFSAKANTYMIKVPELVQKGYFEEYAHCVKIANISKSSATYEGDVSVYRVVPADAMLEERKK